MDYSDSILFKDMIAYLDSGQPFSLSFVTHDKKRGTGGEWINVKSAVKFMAKGQLAKSIEAAQPSFTMISRNPKHFENSTRNIKLENGSIRKVHIRLIRLFNNKTVI